MKSILSLVCFALLQSGFLLPALAAQPDPQAQSPSAGSSAQESSGVQSEPLTQLDVAAVTQQLERLEADAKLPKANKEELKKLYETARASLEAAQLQRQRELSHKKEREDAPQQLQELRRLLQEKLPEPELPDLKSLSLEDLQTRARLARERVEEAERELEQVDARIARRGERMPVLPQRIQELQGQQSDVQKTARPKDPLSSALEPAAAQRWVQLAKLAQLQAHMGALQAELAKYEAIGELQPVQHDEAIRQRDHAQAFLDLWQVALQQRRKQEADAAAQAARQRAEELRRSPVLAPIAAQNLELRELLSGRKGEEKQPGVSARMTQTEQQIESVGAQISELEGSRDRLVDKLRLAGAQRAVGVLLRRQYQRLPVESELRRRLQDNLRLIEEAQYNRILIKEQRDTLPPAPSDLEQLVESHPGADWTEELRSTAEALLLERRTNLQETHEQLIRYEAKLWSLQRRLTKLLAISTELRLFLQEFILWVRSVSGPLIPGPAELGAGISTLLDASAFREAWNEPMQLGVFERPVSYAAILAVLLLFALRRIGRRRNEHLNRRIARPQTDRFVYSIEALVWIALRAFSVPALLQLAAAYLLYPPAPSSYALGMAAALQNFARLLTIFMFITEMARENGFLETHLRWRPGTRRALRSTLLRVMPVLLLTSLLRKFLEVAENGPGHESLGRIAFVIYLGAWAWLLFKVFRRNGPILGVSMRREPKRLLARTSWLWVSLSIGAPAFLILLTLAGYQYSALVITVRLLETLSLAFLWILLRALLLRWLFVAKRRTALEVAQAKSEGDGAEASGEEEIDLVTMNTQTRRLFGAALFVTMFFSLLSIWSDVIPALNVLDRIEVYPRFLAVGEERGKSLLDLSANLDEGPGAPSEGEKAAGTQAEQGSSGLSGFPIPGAAALGAAKEGSGEALPSRVTLGNLTTFGLIVLFTFLLVRNVPGLLEMVLLARLPFEPGVRFAITTVTRYLIVIIGTSSALSALGIGWSQMQWLVAALTFGLAFGLQEIFANLVLGPDHPVRAARARWRYGDSWRRRW
jgi:potassium efflux system protein